MTVNAEVMEDNENSLIENESEDQLIENLEAHLENSKKMEARLAPPTPTVETASGRVSQPPVQLIEEMGKTALTATQRNFYFALLELNEEKEYGCVGAGIGLGIHSMHELKVLSFEEAMVSEDY